MPLKMLKRAILLISLSLLINSCKSSDLTIGVSDPDQGGVVYSKGGGPKSLTLYKDTKGHVCMPPDDARTLLQECYDLKPEQSKALLNLYLSK